MCPRHPRRGWHQWEHKSERLYSRCCILCSFATVYRWIKFCVYRCRAATDRTLLHSSFLYPDELCQTCVQQRMVSVWLDEKTTQSPSFCRAVISQLTSDRRPSRQNARIRLVIKLTRSSAAGQSDALTADQWPRAGSTWTQLEDNTRVFDNVANATISIIVDARRSASRKLLLSAAKHRVSQVKTRPPTPTPRTLSAFRSPLRSTRWKYAARW